MIPHVIHYCWFGGNPLPQDVVGYINTWRKYCPNYEIKEWNETNFDVSENIYCKEAYDKKKWAFVSDYARLKILYDYGGFYLDTDVEVLKSLNPLCEYDAVSGYETNHSIPTGIIGSQAGNEWIELLLNYYNDRHFIQADGTIDQTTNVIVITKLTKEKYDIKLDGSIKRFGKNNNIVILPFDYLCSNNPITNEKKITKNTYTVHNFSGSWLSETERKYQDKVKIYLNSMGKIPFMNGSWIKVAKTVAALNTGGIDMLKEKVLSTLKRS